MNPTKTQSRTTDLNRQLTSTTSTHSINDTAQIKTLTDRALSAEKRANHASNQLAMLEAKLAEIQSKAGKAEDKWEARVREYENRLRVAGEKIKTEKQGGKERALQLEGQVRWVFSFGFPSVTLHLASSGSYDSTPALCLDSHEELR
jgi:chromosome segregation ATPase